LSSFICFLFNALIPPVMNSGSEMVGVGIVLMSMALLKILSKCCYDFISIRQRLLSLYRTYLVSNIRR
jgi:hypothetical protein